MKSFLYREKVLQARSAERALELLNHGIRIDVAIISSSEGAEQVGKFVTSLRERGISVPVLVALEEVGASTSTTVTELYLQGVSGFISEPYSSEEMQKVFQVLLSQASQPSEDAVRLEKAASFLAADAARRVDEAARALLDGAHNIAQARRALRSIAEKLAEIFERDRGAFERAIISRFESAKPFVNTRTSMKRRVVKFAKHPGLLVAEAIATRGVSAEQLAEKLHLELPQVEQLLQGQYAVDAQLAQELARTIGGTSAEWTARQRAHDEWRRYQEESGATAP